jgi:hypothetical protein
MSLYLLKPIVWNLIGYTRPGGGKFTSGYPKENGFGHEEWNAAAHLTLQEEGQEWRVFHTEGVGSQEVDEHAGDIFVFMIASSQGKQYLVGIAGNATCLHGNKRERQRLVSILHTDSEEHAMEAWQLASVRGCFRDDRRLFLAQWRKEADWAPTWKCPSDYFAWLPEPIVLDPVRLTGKNRLVTMYSTYQPMHQYQAAYLLRAAVLKSPHSNALRRLLDSCIQDDSEEQKDIADITSAPERALSATEKNALILARRGQGRFRDELVRIWGGCAVTGCAQPQVLRASHIKPWRKCSNAERLDPDNGLLLVANLDALFDVGLVTFEDDGRVRFSKGLSAEDLQQLSLSDDLVLRRGLSARTKQHLAYHRETIYREQ